MMGAKSMDLPCLFWRPNQWIYALTLSLSWVSVYQRVGPIPHRAALYTPAKRHEVEEAEDEVEEVEDEVVSVYQLAKAYP